MTTLRRISRLILLQSLFDSYFRLLYKKSYLQRSSMSERESDSIRILLDIHTYDIIVHGVITVLSGGNESLEYRDIAITACGNFNMLHLIEDI